MAPPAPVHVSVKFALAAIAAIGSVPVVGFEPVQDPDAVQLFAFAVTQESVVVPPGTTLTGLAVNEVIDGGALTVTVALEVAPPQFNVNVALAVSGGVASVPDVPFDPLQPPLAVHDVALADVQVNVTGLPEAMAV